MHRTKNWSNCWSAEDITTSSLGMMAGHVHALTQVCRDTDTEQVHVWSKFVDCRQRFDRFQTVERIQIFCQSELQVRSPLLLCQSRAHNQELDNSHSGPHQFAIDPFIPSTNTPPPGFMQPPQILVLLLHFLPHPLLSLSTPSTPSLTAFLLSSLLLSITS